jgi:hypothetical protein
MSPAERFRAAGLVRSPGPRSVDVDAARDELIARGVSVMRSSITPAVPSTTPGRTARHGLTRKVVPISFASFTDPDGNGWLLQEIKQRLPGREWEQKRAGAMDVATLADLLRETEEHHGDYEKTHARHDWWDWYAAYLSARQNGSSPDEAAAAASRYMDEVRHIRSHDPETPNSDKSRAGAQRCSERRNQRPAGARSC